MWTNDKRIIDYSRIISPSTASSASVYMSSVSSILINSQAVSPQELRRKCRYCGNVYFGGQVRCEDGCGANLND